MMAMFVHAFCYGAKLVLDHKNTPGAILWACLICKCVSQDGSLQCSLINPTTTAIDPHVRTLLPSIISAPFLTLNPPIESVFYTLRAIIVQFGGQRTS
jgi:hypothetical protein